MTTVAEVTTIPTNAYSVIVVVMPSLTDHLLPLIPCESGESGIFNETVAQKTNRAVQRGDQELQKSGKLVNRDGTDNMGPNPPAAR